MQLLNLIRAHVFKHSTAALALGRYDLARVISLKKLEALTLQQAKLLSRRKELQDKINQGSIFKWFYQKELNRIEVKSVATMASNITKYHERAISAQAHIEEKLEITMKSFSIPFNVGSITSLTPYMLNSYLYANTAQCLNKANLLVNRSRVTVTHGQTLRSTASMSSNLIYGMHDLAQARYLANRAQCLSNIEAEKEYAAELVCITTREFDECLVAIKEIAKNIKLLAQRLQRPLTPETTLLENIVSSLRQFELLYATAEASDGTQVSIEPRGVLTNLNVLFLYETETLFDTITYLERMIREFNQAQDLPR